MKVNRDTALHIHFIRNSGPLIERRLANRVPRVGDELRFGGPGHEKYYVVTRVVWVYDEPESPFERVNIGIEDAKDVGGER